MDTPKVEIVAGTIVVEGAHGVFYDDAFVICLSIREKYIGALAYSGSPPAVLLSTTSRTRRHGAVVDAAEETDTDVRVQIPGEWVVEASAGRYTCEIIGVRRPVLDDKHAIPITFLTLNLNPKGA